MTRLINKISSIVVISLGIIFIAANVQKSQAIIIFPTSNVAGVVTDQVTGQPLADVEVRLHGGPFFDVTVLTDSNGLYDILVDFCASTLTIEATLAVYESYQASIFVPCNQTLVHDIAINPELTQTREPVLIIPGIAGSELFHNKDEVWMNTSKMQKKSATGLLFG